MRNCMKKLIFLAMLLLLSPLVIAGTKNDTTKTNLVPAHDLIKNFQETINTINQKSSIPAFFPTLVPETHQLKYLYASVSISAANPDYNQLWIINVDATPECQGTHVCNIGSLSAEKSAKLEKTYVTLPENKSIEKQEVKLARDYIGYYTPFHSEASGVNPTLEWQVDNVLYTLRWKLVAPSDEATLVAMTNSAINATEIKQ